MSSTARKTCNDQYLSRMSAKEKTNMEDLHSTNHRNKMAVNPVLLVHYTGNTRHGSQASTKRNSMSIESSFACFEAAGSSVGCYHQVSCIVSEIFYVLQSASHQLDPGTCHRRKELID